MADEFSVRVEGLDRIEARLQALPEKLRRKSIRKALKEAAGIVRAEAEMRCPTRKPGRFFGEPGEGPRLKDNIVARVTVGQSGARGQVGIDYKAVRHGHLVEFGARPHMIGKLKHPGARKQPFMRPAFDARGGEALEIMIAMLAEAVEAEA